MTNRQTWDDRRGGDGGGGGRGEGDMDVAVRSRRPSLPVTIGHPSLCRCVVVSLCRCVVVSFCRCFVVSLCRCVVCRGRADRSLREGVLLEV